MKIGIDARFYGPLGKGLGRYTQKLIENLEEVDDENQYIIFIKKENFKDYKPIKRNFKKVLADYRWYSLTEQLYLPSLIKKYNLDLMHFPHFNVPFFYYEKFIVTIHDLILTQYPTERATTLGPVKYRIKRFGYNLVIRHAVRKAKKIIAVSNFTKSELIKYFNLKEDKIMVTYEAIDPAHPQFPLYSQIILNKYKIKKPYLLYVGNAYPHKNLEGLIQAFKDFSKIKQEYYLVLVGKEDYFFKRLKDEVNMLGLEKKVIFAGFVLEQDLPAIYREADIYVFPSFCEGFGLPPLEAMSYGVPTVSSPAGALKEILGEAAYYFNTYNKNDIIKAIAKVIDDKKLKDELRKKGFEQIKKYNWQKLAESTLSVYNSV